MKQLYIDFDGVILNTTKISFHELRELNIENNFEAREEYFRNIDWYDRILKSEQINNSINNIKKIIDSNKFSVSILTHINSIDEIIAKTEFIRNHIEEIPIISVPIVLSKTNLVNPLNAILIDDYRKNLVEWEESGGMGIHFNEDDDISEFTTINSLDRILEIIE